MPVRIPQLPCALAVPDDDPPDDPSSLAPPLLDASVPWPLLPPGEDELDGLPPPGLPPPGLPPAPMPLPEEAPFDEPPLCAELPEEPPAPDGPQELVELLPAQCERRRSDAAAQARRMLRARCRPIVRRRRKVTTGRRQRQNGRNSPATHQRTPCLASEPMDPVEVEDGRLSQVIDRGLEIDIGEELVVRDKLPEQSWPDGKNRGEAGVTESRSRVARSILHFVQIEIELSEVVAIDPCVQTVNDLVRRREVRPACLPRPARS